MAIDLDQAVAGAFHQIYDHRLGWGGEYLMDRAVEAVRAVESECEWLPHGVAAAEILRRAADEMMVEQMAVARESGASWHQIARCVGRHHSSVERWAVAHGVEERAEQKRQATREWAARREAD